MIEQTVSVAGEVEGELQGLDLGDPRRNRRAVRMATSIARAPNESFPDLTSNGSELEAQYRFISNKHVDGDALLAPHVAATVRRCSKVPLVLAVHDTTKFTFSGSRVGMPQTGQGIRRTSGFEGHFVLAVAPGETNVPLGVLSFERILSKKHIRTRGRRPRKKVPSWLTPRSQKESARWDRGVDEAQSAIGNQAGVIHVADQEADDFAWMAKLLGEGRRFVVRGSQDRVLQSRGVGKVQDILDQQPNTLFRKVVLSAHTRMIMQDTYSPEERRERPAILHLRSARIRIERYRHAQTHVPHVDVNVVQVFEPDPPKGEEALSWTLFTTEPIEAAEQRAFIVDVYRGRWVIEEFFKVLKTGCAYETRQLTSLSALLNALAMLVPIAWRMHALKTAAHSNPGQRAPAELLTPLHLALMNKMSSKLKLDSPTTAPVALRFLAGLGGHLRRNGEPGWITIWRGYRKVLAAEVGLRIALECDTEMRTLIASESCDQS